jgi:hypothetical protein
MDGFRLASNYVKQNTRCHGFTLKPLVLFDRASVPGFKHKLKLWDIEDREGSTLLSGQVLAGLDHTLCVKRELTEGEVRCKLRREAIERGEVVEKTNFRDVEFATGLDPQHMFSDEDESEDESDDDVTEDTADDNAVEYSYYNHVENGVGTYYVDEPYSDHSDVFDDSEDDSYDSYFRYPH